MRFAWMQGFALLGCVIILGCSRPKAYVAAAPDEMMPERRIVTSDSVTVATMAEEPVQARVALATPVKVKVRRPAPPEESPATLERRYFDKSTSAEQRSEIVQAIGTVATPAAAETLGRIFDTERRMEARMEALQVLYDLPDETCREQKFTTLQHAIAPGMSRIMRLSALQSMADFDDPRVPAVLRALSKDRDGDVRKQATELLRDLGK